MAHANQSRSSFPEGSFQQFQSNYVWEIVLGYLIHPLDIGSASSSCLYFRRVLEEKLMTEVFSIFKEKNVLVGGLEYLNCRLVSKSWKNAVEYAFMNQFKPQWHLNYLNGLFLNRCHCQFVRGFKYQCERHPSLRQPQPRELNVTSFFSPKQIDRAISILKHSDHSSASSLVQVVHIDENQCPKNERPEFNLKLQEFFNAYGKHVQGLRYTVNSTSYKEKYEKLLKIVKQTCNLKAFIFRGTLLPFFETPEEAQALKESVQCHPFPTIETLELLRFDYKREHNFFLIEILKKNSKSLKTLTLPTQTAVKDKSFADVMRSLNLQHFQINHRMDYDEIQNQLQFVTSSLQKISCDASVQLPLQELVSILGNRFRDSLQHLEWNNFFNVSENDVLDFPNLKTLRLGHLSVHKNGVNFLTKLSSLQSLDIRKFELLYSCNGEDVNDIYRRS